MNRFIFLLFSLFFLFSIQAYALGAPTPADEPNIVHDSATAFVDVSKKDEVAVVSVTSTSNSDSKESASSYSYSNNSSYSGELPFTGINSKLLICLTILGLSLVVVGVFMHVHNLQHVRISNH